MRTYNRTHPWIRFDYRLASVPATTWILLGQAQAKCEYISRSPADPEFAKQFYNIYLAKGALATTAIEGNTLTEEQVHQIVLAKQPSIPPSQQYMEQQIDNVVEAFNTILDNIINRKAPVYTTALISAYNRTVLKELPLDDEVVPGAIRQHQVTVGRYLGAPPDDCEYLLQQVCDWLNRPGEFPEQFKVAEAILRALFAHLFIAWIHPFGDGNGRTARLIEFDILLRAGVPDVVAHLLSNHYNLTRDAYYRHLDQSHRQSPENESAIFAFFAYALQGFIDGMDKQIEELQTHQLNIYWRNYIHRRFDNQVSPVSVRQRHLILDISAVDRENAGIPTANLRLLTPRVASDYAGKSDKTLRRDLNKLREMDLVIVDGDRVRANLNLLTQFLPRRRT